MAASGDHGKLDITLQGIHKPYQWSFANDAARVAAGSYVSADIGKYAIQTDMYSTWVLTATTPTWQCIGMGIVPRCSVSRATGQAISTGGSGVAVQWTTEITDTDTMFAATDSKLYAKRAGIYVASVSLQWDGASGGTYRYIYVEKNGATLNLGAMGIPDDGAGLAQRCAVTTVPFVMATNDYVECYMLHDFGSDRNFDNGCMGLWAIELT